ncbi:MAG: beta-ketoacyl synthase N-terminal-like domain-containing protein, partial [Flavobacterium sp.]
MQEIYINAVQSFSSLGNNTFEVWSSYLSKKSFIKSKEIDGKNILVNAIDTTQIIEIEQLIKENSKYKNLDATVLFAIISARKTIDKANWTTQDFGINIASSRGATQLFEAHYQEFIHENQTPVLSSPSTTLGNISSWVGQDLQSRGVHFSHSITCSSALHAVLNGVAWLQSNMATHFLVGGSEAALTPFTIAQMQALKLYSKETLPYPCRSLDFKKKNNTLVLGEGAVMAALSKEKTKNTVVKISGVGFATEILKNAVSLSSEGICLEKSMRMALQNHDLKSIDAIVMHAPGTIQGDNSEYHAIEKIFQSNLPLVTSNKWKIGHTFGASGLFSLEMALLMIQNQYFIEVPFVNINTIKKEKLNIILINAVGFGCNAV